MAKWTITKENNPARGTYWVVRRDGSRIGSAPTQASAKNLMHEIQAEAERRGR